MKKFLFVILILCPTQLWATKLLVGEHYIADANFPATVANSSPPTVKVIGRETVMKIVKISGNTVTLDITTAPSSLPQNEKKILWDNFFEVDISKLDLEVYVRVWDTVGHGTLVVPFKVSFKDGSLSSKSVSLGYYVQYPRILTSGGVITGPIYSAGLTSITRNESANTELGATIAAGWIWSIQDKLQLGLVVGLDHLGDKTWEYEDQGWASLMVGFNFLQ